MCAAHSIVSRCAAQGEEVSLASLEEKRIVNLSGREARLPLKVRARGVVWWGAANVDAC